eukprot:TRINITY_DN8244_c0_g1_i1.p1 TRINITY_DN8244_c0_g1~~TRINITY_DN8244_c0_g1_i1.p1  ORF type:complete len:302 (+),score=76.46 TRINITY_DN8244_c0_g1_i1:68-973(+)
MSADEIESLKQELLAVKQTVNEQTVALESERKARSDLEAMVFHLQRQMQQMMITVDRLESSIDVDAEALPVETANTLRVIPPPLLRQSSAEIPDSSPSSSLARLLFGENEPDLAQRSIILEERFSELQSSVEAIIKHFSQTADEKEMVALGDDTRNSEIVHIVRGTFCTALIRILYFGFISKRLIGRYHIWDFFEKTSEDFSKTEDPFLQTIANGVDVVNVYEKMRKDNDIRIRSLICYGLNYRQIHEWMARINPSAPGVSKWFEPWSIFCSDSVRFRLQQTLEPLAACPFLLSVDYEVDA